MPMALGDHEVVGVDLAVGDAGSLEGADQVPHAAPPLGHRNRVVMVDERGTRAVQDEQGVVVPGGPGGHHGVGRHP